MADYNPYAAPQAVLPPPQVPTAAGTPQAWTVGEVVSIAWARFTQRWAILVFSYLLFYVLIQVVTQVITRTMGVAGDSRSFEFWKSPQFWTTTGVSTLAGAIMRAYFDTGLVRIWLGVARGESPSFGLLFSGFDRFLPMLALSFLSTLVIALGTVLLIVPGILLGLGLYFASYYVIDAKMGPIDAMKASWNATKGQKADVFLLYLAGIGLALLGLLMCFIGSLATIPLFSVAAAIAYTRVSGIGVVGSAYGDGAG